MAAVGVVAGCVKWGSHEMLGTCGVVHVVCLSSAGFWTIGTDDALHGRDQGKGTVSVSAMTHAVGMHNANVLVTAVQLTWCKAAQAHAPLPWACQL